MMQENVYQIFHLDDDKLFTEAEAHQLLDVFLPITRKTQNEINALNSLLETYKHQAERADNIQFQINIQIQKWSEKIRRLGGTPISLYQVKIPTFGTRYFFWEFPKSSVKLV